MAVEIFLNDQLGIREYTQFEDQVGRMRATLKSTGYSRGLSYVIEAINNFATYCKFIALIEEGHCVHPCPPYLFHDMNYRAQLTGELSTDFIYCGDNQDLGIQTSQAAISGRQNTKIGALQRIGGMPLILRTSGSSGKKYKYILHDYRKFRAKFMRRERHFDKVLAFFPFDSVAGVEVLTEVLAHRRTLVTTDEKMTPARVTQLIQSHKIDYFQTTPTFLNLLLIGHLFDRQKLVHLRKIFYGSEPSVRSHLVAIQEALPGIELMHVYGMTEIGILSTKTCPSDPSLFLLDDEFNPGRIVAGLLEVTSPTLMIDYLNIERQPMEDDWFPTNDSVEQFGHYLRVLGRNDDILNVAGRKFYPSELENLLQGMPNVAEITIGKEQNSLIGEAIVAQVMLCQPEEESAFRVRFRSFCEDKVPYFMHPHRLMIVTDNNVSSRFKKIRTQMAESP